MHTSLQNSPALAMFLRQTVKNTSALGEVLSSLVLLRVFQAGACLPVEYCQGWASLAGIRHVKASQTAVFTLDSHLRN